MQAHVEKKVRNTYRSQQADRHTHNPDSQINWFSRVEMTCSQLQILDFCGAHVPYAYIDYCHQSPYIHWIQWIYGLCCYGPLLPRAQPRFTDISGLPPNIREGLELLVLTNYVFRFLWVEVYFFCTRHSRKYLFQDISWANYLFQCDRHASLERDRSEVLGTLTGLRTQGYLAQIPTMDKTFISWSCAFDLEW